MKPPLTNRDWLSKAGAGTLLGFLLALGFSGLVQQFFRVIGPLPPPAGQLGMWLMSPVWALTLSACFLFRSGARAWSRLALANLAVWGPAILLKGIVL